MSAKCDAVYRCKYAVMDGARCDLPAGHSGEHKSKWGVGCIQFGPRPEDCKVISDGSQGWQWPQEAA